MRPARVRAVLPVLPFLTAGCDRAASTGSVPGPAPAAKFGAEPTFAYDEGGGCYMLFLYRHNRDRSEALIVSAPAIDMKEGTHTFDLSNPTRGVEVKVRVYPRPQKQLPLCAIVPLEDADEPVDWKAARGKLTVERFPLDPQPKGQARTFRAKATIEAGTEFRSPDGRDVKCPLPIILDATVGWNP